MPNPVAIKLAETQHGLISRHQLREAGLSFRAIDALFNSREWHPMTDQVARRFGSPVTDSLQATAAVLDAGAGAALAYLSAASVWGLTGCPLRPLHVVRTSSSRRHCALARVHRVRSLPPRWSTVLDGIPIVRPELLALQLFAACSSDRAELLTDRLWSNRLLSGPSVARFLDQMGRRGRNGTAGLRSYLEVRGPTYVPPASGLESRASKILRDVGIRMRRQVDSGGDTEWTGRVDLRHELLPLIVEIQSEKYHTALCDHDADRRRIAKLVADGFVVIEITDLMVWSQPGEFTDRVRAAIHQLSHAA